jgi:hypothetical protein
VQKRSPGRGWRVVLGGQALNGRYCGTGCPFQRLHFTQCKVKPIRSNSHLDLKILNLPFRKHSKSRSGFFHAVFRQFLLVCLS